MCGYILEYQFVSKLDLNTPLSKTRYIRYSLAPLEILSMVAQQLTRAQNPLFIQRRPSQHELFRN